MKQTILRFASVLMAVAMLLTALPAALSEENSGAVQRIDLNIDAITIGVGQSVKTIKPVAYPEGSSAKFTWQSDNKDIATVNSSGKIKGIKKGTANITITADNGVSAKVKVTVAAKGKGVTRITLNKKKRYRHQGKFPYPEGYAHPKEAQGQEDHLDFLR